MSKVKLVVVIVLHHREAELSGNREESEAALRLHQHRGGKLVMWRDIDGSNAFLAADFLQLINKYSLSVQAHRNNIGSYKAKRLARRRIAQLFHHYCITGAYDDAGSEIDRHLAAPRDADIVGGCDEAAI